jgi:hypothetical protein
VKTPVSLLIYLGLVESLLSSRLLDVGELVGLDEVSVKALKLLEEIPVACGTVILSEIRLPHDTSIGLDVT